MLLGTFLIVYSCKHAKAMHESGREVGEKALQSAKEGLRETLDSLTKSTTPKNASDLHNLVY
jgi:hypothetical protein